MIGLVERWAAQRRLRRRDDRADSHRRPDPSRPEGTDRLPEIRHIVVLMMENHSFDNYFGTLGRGRGFVTGPDGQIGPLNRDKDGEVVQPFHFPSSQQPSDSIPTQTWHASHIQCGDGEPDGFIRSVEETIRGGDPRIPMGYWDAGDLPFYSSLAETFALADGWHCSLLGPTFPNRRFLVAGTAHGLIDSAKLALIDYPPGGTIFDLLDRNRIPWADYHHVTGPRRLLRLLAGGLGARVGRALGLLAVAAKPDAMSLAVDNLQFTADVYPIGALRLLRHLRPIGRFFRDAAEGTLPAVSIVDPDFQASSEENPQDIHVGEGFAAAVINAVMAGPGWPHTVLVWLYDEHGGYFDHVPPPAAVEPDGVRPHSLLHSGGILRWLLRATGGWSKLADRDAGPDRYDQLGFRVPAVVVSPYAKAGYVSSTVYDHTSVLKLIEQKWNLPPLTERDAHASDPLDMLDLTDPPFVVAPTLAPPAVPWPIPSS